MQQSLASSLGLAVGVGRSWTDPGCLPRSLDISVRANSPCITWGAPTCAKRHENDLQVGALRILQRVDGELVLLLLKRSEIGNAVFNRLDNVGLLGFGGEQLSNVSLLQQISMKEATL